MRFSITVVLCLASALFVMSGVPVHAKKNEAEVLKIHESCVTKLGLPGDIAKLFANSDYPKGPHSHCYVKCMLEALTYYDEKKGFNLDLAYSGYMDRKEVDRKSKEYEIFSTCAKKYSPQSGACTFVYRVSMCWEHKLNEILKTGH